MKKKNNDPSNALESTKKKNKKPSLAARAAPTLVSEVKKEKTYLLDYSLSLLISLESYAVQYGRS